MEANVPPTFEHLMLPHLDAAYNLACWLLRDPHEAEDAVQDACVRAFRSMDRFRGGDGRPWLLAIVRNGCYSRLRERQRTPAPAEYVDELHGTTMDPGEANRVAWREVKTEQLQTAMDRLPEPLREVIVLHELEGMAYKEIAGVIEVPIGTVMSRLSRARQTLQKELHGL